jgi:tryptophan-rich sensory protein
VLAQAPARAFNPLWIALAVGVALTGVAVWQARKTDKELKRAAPKAPVRRARRD